MSHSINGHFTPISLLKFAAPSIIMMMFMSLYTIIDGIFISRFVGSNALSSLNIVYPIINIVFAIGTMLGTGGNAIISRYMGEGKNKTAKECMTQFVVIGLIISVIILVLTRLNLSSISRILGASDLLLADCNSYLAMVISFAPAAMLQCLFQSYFVTAGRPNLGLFLTMIAGILNAVLDYVFIVVCQMGISGAGLATGIGQMVPAVSLHLKEFMQACYNGSSEMISQLSNAIITFLFNIVMMRLAGEHGVAAITILLYGQFLFNAFYLGFSIGISPIVGFQYGAGNKKELKNIHKISFLFVGISSILLTIAAITLSTPIVTIFTHDAETFRLAAPGFRIFAVNFLFSGLNITSSGFFTALSNGLVSAIISFCRTLVFIVLCLLILPSFLDLNGAWIAIPVAEFLTLILSAAMHIRYFFRPGKQNYL